MPVEVVSALGRLFALLAIGWALRRAGRVGPGTPDALTEVVIELTMPALIVSTLLGRTLDSAMLGAVVAGLAGLLGSLGAGILLAPWASSRPAVRGTFVLCAGFCNTGFLGIPVAHALWGPGSAGLSTAVMVDSFTTTLLLNTLGVFLALRYGSGGAFDASALGKLVRQPMFLAVPLGFGLQALDAKPPGPVMDLLTLVGGATVPLVFLATGMRLRFQAAWRERRAVAAITALRFGLSPALALGVALAFGLTGEVGHQAVLEVATPTALMAPVIATRYGCDEELGPAVVAVTTALSPLALLAWLGIGAAAGLGPYG